MASRLRMMHITGTYTVGRWFWKRKVPYHIQVDLYEWGNYRVNRYSGLDRVALDVELPPEMEEHLAKTKGFLDKRYGYGKEKKEDKEG